MASDSGRSGEQILFVVAIAAELRPVLERRGVWPITVPDAGWPMVSLGDHASLVISGIGRSNAAAATAFALTRTSCHHVINIGVAGALPKSGLDLGDVIIADESTFFEEGIELPTGWRDVQELGFPLGQSTWAHGNVVSADPELVKQLHSKLQSPSIRVGTVATVATCSGTDDAANEVVTRTGAIAEAMEGAAVVATARHLGYPAAEIRVISNTCGVRESQRWDFKSAVQRLSDVVETLIGA